MTRWWALVLAGLAAGCSGPTDTGGTEGPPRAFASAGDHQVGGRNAELPVLLEVTVVNAASRPLPGVAVSWGSVQNGIVQPLDAVTDAQGRAHARFILGDVAGPASVHAEVVNVGLVLFAFEALEEEPPPPPPPPYGTFIPQGFTTFEGSGQTVHPDYARTPWAQTEQLAITPYPGGNANVELPSLFSGSSGTAWSLAPGVPNPVVPAPALGHMSDPDIVWEPESRELWMYYRQAADRNLVWLIRSADGAHWSAPQLVVSVPNHELLSPSVVRRGPGDWWMWSVNGGSIGCSAASTQLEVRRSTDGRTWSPPVKLSLAHDGLTPWHVDVQWVPERGEFWAAYNAKSSGSCTTPALFFATSRDGLAWTPIRPAAVAKGVHPALQDVVYRSSFRYDPVADDIWLWISGARFEEGKWIWRTVFQRRHRADLLEARMAASLRLQFAPPPAELVDWP